MNVSALKEINAKANFFTFSAESFFKSASLSPGVRLIASAKHVVASVNRILKSVDCQHADFPFLYRANQFSG